MDVPPPEHRRVKMTTGNDTQPNSSTKLEHLGTSHPFTRQIDVLFPSSDVLELEAALRRLPKPRYARRRVKLADVLRDFADEGVMMFSADARSDDDAWCVDSRGLLTLLVTKETYERLGIVGARVPFKAHREYFVMRLWLKKEVGVESVGDRARWREAVGRWDKRREREGLGAWDVVCSCAGEQYGPHLLGDSGHPGAGDVREVVCGLMRCDDVDVPLVSSSLVGISDRQGRDDWDAEMAALFEWVGMASLCSQRLKANDRVDPYVALYECPSPSYVGSITRLRWHGLVGPAFLQSVIDTVVATLKSLPANDKAFVAITAHSCLASPVSYVAPSAPVTGGPMRLAREDGEDTWCLLAAQGVNFALVESVGQYDTRSE